MMPSQPLSDTVCDVLVVGGGPVGMFTALRLAQLGQKCVLMERSRHTTRHPKMAYTSHRTMELYHRAGIIDCIRSQGVPEHYGFDEVFKTGLSEGNYTIVTLVRPTLHC